MSRVRPEYLTSMDIGEDAVICIDARGIIMLVSTVCASTQSPATACAVHAPTAYPPQPCPHLHRAWWAAT